MCPSWVLAYQTWLAWHVPHTPIHIRDQLIDPFLALGPSWLSQTFIAFR